MSDKPLWPKQTQFHFQHDCALNWQKLCGPWKCASFYLLVLIVVFSVWDICTSAFQLFCLSYCWLKGGSFSDPRGQDRGNLATATWRMSATISAHISTVITDVLSHTLGHTNEGCIVCLKNHQVIRGAEPKNHTSMISSNLLVILNNSKIRSLIFLWRCWKYVAETGKRQYWVIELMITTLLGFFKVKEEENFYFQTACYEYNMSRNFSVCWEHLCLSKIPKKSRLNWRVSSK